MKRFGIFFKSWPTWVFIQATPRHSSIYIYVGRSLAKTDLLRVTTNESSAFDYREKLENAEKIRRENTQSLIYNQAGQHSLYAKGDVNSSHLINVSHIRIFYSAHTFRK